MASAPYGLDELGWLQFERLCGLVLAQEAGLVDITWLGRADRGRVALIDAGLRLGAAGHRLRGPLAVAVVWVRPGRPESERLTDLFAGVCAVPSELGFWFDRVVVLTNLEGSAARDGLGEKFGKARGFTVFGASELGEILDRHAELRAAMPSVLGLRDLGALIDPDARKRSSMDISAAQELARVFWATRAYERARIVLGRHRFVVLTGPPEMGKSAIARMLALAQLTDGWEAHECTNPEHVWEALDRDRAQLFVADDAFGSTEYRADAAELWARELGRILRVLDDRHWLIWTSRPAPLKAGLRRVQRERGVRALSRARRGPGRRERARSGREDADPVPARQEPRGATSGRGIWCARPDWRSSSIRTSRRSASGDSSPSGSTRWPTPPAGASDVGARDRGG